MNYPPGRCYGRLDVPLAPGWRAWARDQAAILHPYAARLVWSSPAQRCRLAATVIAEALGLPVCLDSRLLELDFGDWEGQAWDEIPRGALDRWVADPSGFRPPEGESGAQLMARAASFVSRLLGESRSSIVVSHGGMLRLLPALLRGEPADLLAPSPAIGSLVRVQRPAAPAAPAIPLASSVAAACNAISSRQGGATS